MLTFEKIVPCASKDRFAGIHRTSRLAKTVEARLPPNSITLRHCPASLAGGAGAQPDHSIGGPRESKSRLSIFVRQAMRYIQQNECAKQGKSP
jgi:hypothetical protein